VFFYRLHAINLSYKEILWPVHTGRDYFRENVMQG
jgi:hypothetical protein